MCMRVQYLRNALRSVVKNQSDCEYVLVCLSDNEGLVLYRGPWLNVSVTQKKVKNHCFKRCVVPHLEKQFVLASFCIFLLLLFAINNISWILWIGIITFAKCFARWCLLVFKKKIESLMCSFKKIFQSFLIYFIQIMTNIHGGFNVKGFLFRILGNFRSNSFIFKGDCHTKKKR